MNASAHLLLGAISLAAGLALAEPGPLSRRIVAPVIAGEVLELPKLAVVTDCDESGTRWQVSGELPAALPVAARDFAASMKRQGWRVAHRTPMMAEETKSELWTWIKGGRRMLVMLSEEAPRATAFYIGEMK